MLTRRTALGVSAVIVLAIALAWRLHRLATEPRLRLSPRVVALMDNRMLARRILAYANAYGRPAYVLDSVEAHVDTSDAQLVSDLTTDPWGDPVHYDWNYCGFTLARTPGVALPASWWRSRRYVVREDYAWPAHVGRKNLCE